MYLVLLLLFSSSSVLAQPNCGAYKYFGDTIKYKACLKAIAINGHYQFSKEFQIILDEALEIDSTFDYAYREKSVAYLKSGDFVTWKIIVDKAVKYNPIGNMGYRAGCRYHYFRDYKGAIEDIEYLERTIKYNIGYSGNYHLNILKGLCFKGLGEREKALRIIEEQITINEQESFVGIYDYLHLGVLYLETNNLERAVEFFRKQSLNNEIAENQYYLALSFKKLGQTEEYKLCLDRAKKLYMKGERMYGTYTNPMDKIYLDTIENEIKTIYKTRL